VTAHRGGQCLERRSEHWLRNFLVLSMAVRDNTARMIDIDVLFRHARQKAPEGMRWATSLVRALESKSAGSGVRWAQRVVGHFLFLDVFQSEKTARTLYRDLIESGRHLASQDELRSIWIHHEGRLIEIAVLRLWTAISRALDADDAGAAVELLFEDARLDPMAIEAPLMLFRAIDQNLK
jgi:hypothetical protein